jgi:hypothetical protein
VALQLKRQGITRVRPLQGGFQLWMDQKFPTIELKLSAGEPGLESPAQAGDSISLPGAHEKKEE